VRLTHLRSISRSHDDGWNLTHSRALVMPQKCVGGGGGELTALPSTPSWIWGGRFAAGKEKEGREWDGRREGVGNGRQWGGKGIRRGGKGESGEETERWGGKGEVRWKGRGGGGGRQGKEGRGVGKGNGNLTHSSFANLRALVTLPVYGTPLSGTTPKRAAIAWQCRPIRGDCNISLQLFFCCIPDEYLCFT